MDDLKYYDQGHVYEYQGITVPSVSELLRFMSRDVYGGINQFILDNAAERGTAVHEATQALDCSGCAECTASVVKYVEAYALFLREHCAEWVYVEKAMAHPGMRYAGTIDRAGVLDGKSCILDIKTSNVIKKPLVKAQLNGYRLLMEANGFFAEKLWCLQLLQNGRYRLYPAAIDDTEFMACYKLHTSLKQRHGRGKIE